MATPSLPHAKDRTESAEKSQSLRSPAPEVEGFASPFLELQRAAGNRAVGHLLRGSLLQAKLRIGPPGDTYEREADRVADAVLREDDSPFSVSVAAGAGVQRMCHDCEEELLQRAPQEAGEEAPSTEEFTPEPESPEPAPEVAPETSPGEPAPEAAAADQAPAVALIVEDDATEVGEGQMKKSDFLARLRPEVCAAAEAGLAGTEHSAQGCPYIDFFFGYYEGQSAERFNRDLPRFAGDGPRPAMAEEYIPLIAERVRQSVTTWARTGEVTGVPRGIPLPGMGLLGGVFFKALPGGPRNPGSPQALRAQLGAGRPLDGSIRSRMESAFGHSFSHVRVHADGSAAGLSHRLNARAFTVGEHVAFGSQQYRPGTVLGDALLAHELAHVAQQDRASEAVQPMRADTTSYGALERDADMAAVGAVASLWGLRLPGLRLPLRAAPRLSSGLRLQRCKNCNGQTATPSTASPAAPGPETAPAETPNPPAAEAPAPAVTFCATESDHAGIIALRAKAGLAAPKGTLAYGFTFWSPKNSATKPKLEIDWTKAGSAWTGTVKRTTVAMGTIEALYLKEGDHEIPGKKVKARGPQCGAAGKDVPFVSNLSKDLSLLSRSAEQEHCNDYRRAYDLTYQKWADNINALAGRSFGPGTKAAVKTQIDGELSKMGDKGRNGWVAELDRLNALSVSARDGSGWHSLKPDGAPVAVDATCTKVQGTTVKAVTTNVPGPSSEDLVK